MRGWAKDGSAQWDLLSVVQLSLMATCALPGCPLAVAEPGDVCRICIEAFGPYLARCEARPGVTREQIADELAARDRSAMQAYSAQAAIAARGGRHGS